MARRLTQGIAVDRLDQLIKDLGVRARVWKSTLCPNMTSLESIDHDINCTVCNTFMIDFTCQETLVLFQQQDLTEMFKVQGTFHIDKVYASFPSGITLGIFAKVELLDFKEDFYELIQRQEGTDTDLLKYRACEVLGCFTVKDNVKTEYHYGTDFELDRNGSVKWISSHIPADREVYTIYYRYHPVFRAVEAVHRDRYSQFNTRPDQIEAPKKTVEGRTYVKLPEAWILKRDYLIERRDAEKALLPKNVYYDPNEET